MRVQTPLLLAALFVAVPTLATAKPLDQSTPVRWYAYPLDLVAQKPCQPRDINDSGQVVGINSRNEYDIIGFVTGINGRGAIPLSLGGKSSAASAINDKGRVVGTSYADQDGYFIYAYITDPGGVNIRPIAPNGSSASAINNLDQVAGTLFSDELFITEPNGQNPRVIPTLGQWAFPTAMNSSGQLTGHYGYGVAINHAFVTGPNGSNMIDIHPPEARGSYGLGINDKGEVTGDQFSLGSFQSQQFVASYSDPVPKLVGSLGNLPGGLTAAGDINNKGVLVGSSSRGDKYGRIRVTFAQRGGVLKDLNRYVENLPTGVYLKESPVINNRNQIAATGSDGLCYLMCTEPNCQNPSVK